VISQAERDLISRLNKLYDEGVKYRDEWGKEWDRFLERRRGKFWDERRPSYRINAVLNFLNKIVERKTATLTDSRPMIQIVSRRPGLDDVCDALTRVISAIFEERNWERRLTELIELEQTFGIAGVSTCWDSSLDYGRGDIDILILDPRTFVFDPYISRSWNLKFGEYFILEYTRPTDLLRSKYPERADDIKPDVTPETREDSVIGKIRRFIGTRTPSQPTPTSTISRSIVRQYWIRDRSTKNEDNTLKYPTWRYIIIAGGCVVEDAPNPYIDGDLPIDIMEWDFNVDSAYGFSEIASLEMPQIMFNKVIALIIENAMLMSNGIWIGDENALSDEAKRKLTNEPGSHVWKRRGTELKREPGVPLPPYVMQLPTLLLSGMEKLSSITEVSEGRKPGSVTSGQAIEQLQVAAQTAIRLKARQIEDLIQRVGQKLISRIFQYYTEDRVFHLLGPSNRYEQFIFERDKIRTSLQSLNIPIARAFQDFTFKVVPASSLAVSRWQRGLIAMQLYNSGIIDDEEVLEVLEWPNREKVLARTHEKKESGILPTRQPTRQKLPKQLLRSHPERGLQLPQQ